MARKDTYSFPVLKARNLYAARIRGDGNCLFNALSDQLHGDESKHIEYRNATIDYMRANASHFKSFIAVNAGGGTRRSERIPKRKNAGALSKKDDTPLPTAAEVDSTFQRYLTTMARGGAYGGNLEIIAFGNAFKVNVCVYSEEHGNFLELKCIDDDGGEDIETAYIVHHTWEHYSSIRNLAGPHTGLPNVIFVSPSSAAEVTMKKALAKHTYVQKWMVDEIQQCLPYVATREAIMEALQVYKGDINNAISCLMPASSSSSSRSSSIERDPLTDDEMDQKPSKKANRRSSRPHPLNINESNSNFTAVTPGASSLSPDPSELSAALSKLEDDEKVDPDQTEDEDWRNEAASKIIATPSASTSASNSSAASQTNSGPTRLKLSQPKKPAENLTPTSATPSEKSNTSEYDADGEKPPQPRVIAKPKRRLITGAERDRLEKEKKAARRASLSPTSANSKKPSHSPPVIHAGIKVLSI